MIKGGISMICHGYAEDKNKLLKSNDPSKSKIWILVKMLNIYLNARWCEVSHLKYFILLIQKKSNLDTYRKYGPVVCLLGVDLGYPDELHDLNNNYLLAAEKIKVTKETLSEYQLQIIEDNNFSIGTKG